MKKTKCLLLFFVFRIRGRYRTWTDVMWLRVSKGTANCVFHRNTNNMDGSSAILYTQKQQKGVVDISLREITLTEIS